MNLVRDILQIMVISILCIVGVAAFNEMYLTGITPIKCIIVLAAFPSVILHTVNLATWVDP
jgi:hypothetical protein